MSDPAPLLTVAIPTYNGARHLAETVRGVLAQEAGPFDFLVCDDGSEDDTLAIIRREAGDRVRIESHAERLGLAGNWDRCIRLSRSPWVAILHQDDVWLPGHLAAHRAAIESGGADLGLVISGASIIDADSQPISSEVVPPPDLGTEDATEPPGRFVRALATHNPVRCSAATVSVAAYDKVGGFDPAYRYALDWEFWVRLARAYAVRHLVSPTVQVRWHAESETHRFTTGLRDLEEIGRVMDQVDRIDGPTWSDRRALRAKAHRNLARAYLHRAYQAARGGDSRLTRKALTSAFRLDPRTVTTLAGDPRLTARLVLGALGVRSSGRR